MKLTKLLLELFLENNTKIVKWLGSEGLYTPGMQGLDGVKAHLLDIPQEEIESEKYSNLDRTDQYVVLGLSLESLTTGQLLILALANYQGQMALEGIEVKIDLAEMELDVKTKLAELGYETQEKIAQLNADTQLAIANLNASAARAASGSQERAAIIGAIGTIVAGAIA